jgi:hypothetical protein
MHVSCTLDAAPCCDIVGTMNFDDYNLNKNSFEGHELIDGRIVQGTWPVSSFYGLEIHDLILLP